MLEEVLEVEEFVEEEELLTLDDDELWLVELEEFETLFDE